MPQQAARSAHCNGSWTTPSLHHGFPSLTYWASVLPNLFGLIDREHQFRFSWIRMLSSGRVMHGQ
eukprot:9000729-Karenia_brevis.AAC.1